MLPVAILAGGMATRLRPLTETCPKSLVEIAGEPFLAHQLRLLRANGITRVVMCCGYLGEKIRDYAGDGGRFDLHIDYSFDGDRLRGTAGALAQALPFLGDRFLVLYGDSYLPVDYQALANAWLTTGLPALMTVYRNQGQWDASNVEFFAGHIVRYDKRNKTAEMQYIDYGLGAFHRSVFDGVAASLSSGREAYDLATLYEELLARGQLAGLEVHERFYEIGSFAGISELTQLLSGR